MIETICRNCAFNIKNKEGKQIGCHFDRLEKFERAGITIKDSECGQYKVIGDICNLCYMEDLSVPLEKAKEIALNNSKIKYDIILEETLIDDIKNTFKQISSLDVKPRKIIFLNHTSLSNLSTLFDSTKIPWEIVTAVNSKLTLDDGIDKVKSEYFAFKVKNYEIFNTANNLINERFVKFFLIQGIDGYLVNTKSYKFFVGNMNNFPDKLINLPSELKIGNMVFEWKDLQS